MHWALKMDIKLITFITFFKDEWEERNHSSNSKQPTSEPQTSPERISSLLYFVQLDCILEIPRSFTIPYFLPTFFLFRMSIACFTDSIIDDQLVEEIFHSQVILNRFLCFCLSLIFVISARLNLSIHIKCLDFFLLGFRNAHLPHVRGCDVWKQVKRLSLTETIQLFLYEWKSRENLASGIGFSTTLCKSYSFLFFWLLGQYLGLGE